MCKHVGNLCKCAQKTYANMHKDAMHANMKGRYTKLTVSFVRYCGIL